MKRIEKYITEKFKISKDIENNNIICKYFIDKDYYNIKDKKLYGDMGYTMDGQDEIWFETEKELLNAVQSDLEYDIDYEKEESIDDFSILIVSTQIREYDINILKEEDEEVEDYPFGIDPANSEIKRESVNYYISKEFIKYFKKRMDYYHISIQEVFREIATELKKRNKNIQLYFLEDEVNK